MTDLTRNEVHQAWLAFRQEHGYPAAQKLLSPFGGVAAFDDPANFEDIKAAMDGFNGDGGEAPPPTSRKRKTPEEQAKRMAQIHKKAWARFNNPPKQREDGL